MHTTISHPYVIIKSCITNRAIRWDGYLKDGCDVAVAGVVDQCRPVNLHQTCEWTFLYATTILQYAETSTSLPQNMATVLAYKLFGLDKVKIL